MVEILADFAFASQPRYGNCPTVGKTMDKSDRTLLRKMDGNKLAFEEINSKYIQMENIIENQEELCYFSDSLEFFPKLQDFLSGLKPIEEKSDRKIVGRLSDLMNYMTFVDLSGLCPANKIVADCNTINELKKSMKIHRMSHLLAKLSRHYSTNCHTYDFAMQYISIGLLDETEVVQE
jgi:hypothetical protein